MTSNNEALFTKIERVKKLIQQFPAAASKLNESSDKLGKSVSQLEAVLKKFSLGIPMWVTFNGSASSVPSYYHEDLGYAKVNGRWGLAIRTVSGDVRADEGDQIDQWCLNEAPRHLRVQGVPKIPELLTGLLEGAEEMSKELDQKAREVDALTEGISSVIDQPSKPSPAQHDASRGLAENLLRYAESVVPTGRPLQSAGNAKARK